MPSWRLALNLLTGRRWRTALMIITVVLSAGLITTVGCAIASLERSTQANLDRFVGTADVRIIHPANGRFDATLLDTVRRWPEVSHAAGRRAAIVILEADAADADGDPLRVRPRAIGIDFEDEWRIRTYPLEAGELPTAPDEILIDDLTADELGVGVGDRVRLLDPDGDPVGLVVAGQYRRPRFEFLTRPRIYLDRAILDRVSDEPGALTSIYVVLNEGIDPATVVDARAADVSDALTIEPAEALSIGMERQQRANRVGTTIITMLTFMGASFIVLTCLTTGVTERQRQMAILRCIGAERVQLLRAQLLVGVLVGGVGGLLGVPFGLGLTWILTRVYETYLAEGLVVRGSALVLAVGGSLLAGSLGALYPALSASRVMPLQALARPAEPPRPRHVVTCLAAGLGLIGVQAALLLVPDEDLRYWAYAFAGLPLMFAGWFLLAPPMLVLVTRVLGPAIARALGLPGDLLVRTVLGTPFRHGFTAGALMVGMALLVGAWASGTAVQQDWLAQLKLADGFVFRPPPGIGPGEQRAIADLDEVAAISPIGYVPVKVEDRQLFGVQGLTPSTIVCVGIDPDPFFELNAAEWRAGDPDTARAALRAGTGILVEERFLIAGSLDVGDTLTVSVGRRTATFTVAGVITGSGFDLATQLLGVPTQYMDFATGCIFVDFATLGRAFDNRDALMVQIELAAGVGEEDATDAIEAAAPGATFYGAGWIMDTIDDLSAAIMAIYSVVAFAALVLASLAVGNVLAANIDGRQFEYGVLRAIGVERGRLVRLLLGEAILLAIAGIVIGTGTGLYASAVELSHARNYAGLPVAFTVPWIPIIAGAAVLIAVTLVVAAPGAVRVARATPSALLARGRNE